MDVQNRSLRSIQKIRKSKNSLHKSKHLDLDLPHCTAIILHLIKNQRHVLSKCSF